MQQKTPNFVPKIEDQSLTRWLQFLRDDINNMNVTIEELKKEIEALKVKNK